MRGSTFKRKRKDGTVTYGVIFDDLPSANKKRKQRRMGGFCTKQEAVQKLHDIRTAMRSGQYYEPTRLTVSEYSAKWLAEISHSVRARTVAGYRQRLDDHLLTRIGHMPMWAVQPQHIKDLHDSLLREGRKRKLDTPVGLKPRSVVHVHRIAHAMFSEAVRSQIIPSNPCSHVRPPRVARVEQRVLDESEVKGLIEAAGQSPLQPFIVLAVSTGARSGELAALTWHCVDLESGRINIAFGQARDGSPTELKTRQSRRNVALPPGAVSLLKAHKARQKLARGENWSDQGLVFADEIGRPWLVQAISGKFKAVAVLAGLDASVHTHTLRHTYASLALKGGVPVTTVSANLGHSSPSTTMNVYAHHIPSTEDAAAKVMERALKGLA
jgi:integrase